MMKKKLLSLYADMIGGISKGLLHRFYRMFYGTLYSYHIALIHAAKEPGNGWDEYRDSLLQDLGTYAEHCYSKSNHPLPIILFKIARHARRIKTGKPDTNLIF